MCYLYDIIFTVLFLWLKRFLMCIHDSHYAIYMQIRKLAIYVEVSFVLLASYFSPYHTASEKAVAFFLCLISVRTFGTLILKSKIKSYDSDKFRKS